MRRVLTASVAGLAILWGSQSDAAIALIGGASLGSGQATAAVATQTMIDTNTTAVPANSLVVVDVGQRVQNTINSCTDSAATPNTYSAGATTLQVSGATSSLRMFYSYLTSPLPAPCTVTATETSTTLAVTAAVTCSGTDAITVGQAISGGSFTGTISAPCVLVAGAATCTITGGATVATPGTATISSTITCTTNGATSVNRFVSAAAFSGIASSAQFDASVTASVSPATPTVTTGTLSFAAGGTQAVLVANLMWNTTGVITEDSTNTWTSLSTGALNSSMHMAYKIVSATTAVTYAPTIGSNPAWAVMVQDFRGLGTGVTCGSRALMGVGC